MVSRALFGVLLAAIVLLFAWLAIREVGPGITGGNWVSYIGAVLFLAALAATVMAGLNLIRAKRR